MQAALIFSGQGSQIKGMAAALLAQRGSAEWHRWIKADHWLQETHGASLTVLAQDNPPRVTLDNVPYVLSTRGNSPKPTVSGQVSTAASDATGAHAATTGDDTPLARLSAKTGALDLTQIKQPALLAFHLASLDQWTGQQTQEAPWTFLKKDLKGNTNVPFVVMGNSLGEFSAAAAIGFIPEFTSALELVYQRGKLMIDQRSSGGHMSHPIERSSSTIVRDDSCFRFLCNPNRAELTDRTFSDLIQSIAAMFEAMSKAELLEVTNWNIPDGQVVVTGTVDALHVLGRCLDPAWRRYILQQHRNTQRNQSMEDKTTQEASALWCKNDPMELTFLIRSSLALLMDDYSVTQGSPLMLPEEEMPLPYVPGSKHRVRRSQVMRERDLSPDGGWTLPSEQLPGLSGEGKAGRSGLRRRPWFFPLPFDPPFHSSILAKTMDELLPRIEQTLAPAKRIEELSQEVCWIHNLTARQFEPNSQLYRQSTVEAMEQLNVGERAHAGRAQPRCLEDLKKRALNGDARELLAAVLTAQVSKAVRVGESLDKILQTKGKQMIEVSPTPTVVSMIRRMSPNTKPFIIPKDLEALRKTFK